MGVRTRVHAIDGGFSEWRKLFFDPLIKAGAPPHTNEGRTIEEFSAGDADWLASTLKLDDKLRCSERVTHGAWREPWRGNNNGDCVDGGGGADGCDNNDDDGGDGDGAIATCGGGSGDVKAKSKSTVHKNKSTVRKK